MNHKDPHWQEKMKQRKLLEIKRMEQVQAQVQRELLERKSQLEKDQKLSQ
jgi:hypothetical protein